MLSDQDYPGETAQRLLERVFHHNGRDSKSNLAKSMSSKNAIDTLK